MENNERAPVDELLRRIDRLEKNIILLRNEIATLKQNQAKQKPPENPS